MIELEKLYKELEDVKASVTLTEDEKAESIDEIQDEIDRYREGLEDDYDYAPGELEEERRNICLSQGLYY